MSGFPDPVFEAVATLHRQQNEYADKANRQQKNSDLYAVGLVSLMSCHVMLRLKESMPSAEYEALHARLHREVPLTLLEYRS